MQNNDLVWYACYGSNISTQRFLCYIEGGTPPGAKQTYKGCENKTRPSKSKPVSINRELYFAQKAPTWNGGGVAFLNPEKTEIHKSFGRKYLITKDQFKDLLRQELNFEGEIQVDFELLSKNGSLNCMPEGRYGQLLYLGEDESIPVVSFTSEKYLDGELNAPSDAYLTTIIKGLREIYELDDAEIVDYFGTKAGIKGTELEKRLKELAEAGR
ncbi:hypothetical protein [Christiangramia salexigens]|uniref:Histone deacetylase n=1 Tax=Christiangramia salexigens TaxID=1913577 RepID=A0A1L3J6G6_9FLAO|nr:hypothetical protein [Christiangramia salexigens]APG60690.1 hypothetical protein LPB144_09875 [Christiangramia salexigens]